ncbi:MAG: hypothetical protein GY913_30220 [Proteobacteria bacterium]|nr:hypothetical protein [Pseudomonadota bacterium]MCP4921194.1 hypothetical protein [Pseudomonadota bacterium]
MLPLLVSLACTGSTAGPDSQDSGASTDTGSSTSDCPAFHGIRSASSKWVHVNDTASYTPESLYTHQVVAYDPIAGTASISTHDYRLWTDGSQSMDNTIVETYSCDEGGLYRLGNEAEIHSISGDYENEYSSTLTYDSPLLVRPGALALGDTWLSTTTWTNARSDGNDTSGELSQDWVVGEVDVTEGDYTGFRIDQMLDGEAYSHYFAADVGIFLNGYRRLDSYTP